MASSVESGTAPQRAFVAASRGSALLSGPCQRAGLSESLKRLSPPLLLMLPSRGEPGSSDPEQSTSISARPESVARQSFEFRSAPPTRGVLIRPRFRHQYRIRRRSAAIDQVMNPYFLSLGELLPIFRLLRMPRDRRMLFPPHLLFESVRAGASSVRVYAAAAITAAHARHHSNHSARRIGLMSCAMPRTMTWSYAMRLFFLRCLRA